MPDRDNPIRQKGTRRRALYLDAIRQQMILWLNGRSVHNAISGECTPDFSCCHPDMESPHERKVEQFRKFIEEAKDG
jgi:hypothetical protein